jgi:hypothetical protein
MTHLCPPINQVKLIAAYSLLPAMAALLVSASKHMIQFQIIGTSYSIIRMYKTLCKTFMLIRFELYLDVSMTSCLFFSSFTSTQAAILFVAWLVFASTQYLLCYLAVSRKHLEQLTVNPCIINDRVRAPPDSAFT